MHTMKQLFSLKFALAFFMLWSINQSFSLPKESDKKLSFARLQEKVAKNFISEKSELKKLAVSDSICKVSKDMLLYSDSIHKQVNHFRMLADQASNPYMQQQLANMIAKSERDALNRQFKALDNYQLANTATYNIYSQHLESLRAKTPKNKLRIFVELERQAGELFKKAKIIRLKNKKDDNVQTLAQLMKAYEMENQSLNKQLLAFSVYEEWVVPDAEFIKANEIDLNTKTVSAENEDDNDKGSKIKKKHHFVDGKMYRAQILATKNSLTDEQVKKLYKGNESIDVEYVNGWYKYFIGEFESYKEAENFIKTNSIPKAFVTVCNVEKVEKESKSIKGVYYTIQLAATKSPISDRELNQMKHQNMMIKIEKADGWFKYTVGTFKTKQEAEAFLRKVSSSKAFVVSVKDKNNSEEN